MKTDIVRQFIRFCVVGVINTVINYGLYLLLLLIIRSHYLIAGAIGFIAGAVFGFFLNRKWTFSTSDTPKKMIWIYLLINVISLGINTLVLYIAVNLLHIPKIYAQLLGIAVTTIVNFVGVKFFVFRITALHDGEKNVDKT